MQNSTQIFIFCKFDFKRPSILILILRQSVPLVNSIIITSY